MRSKFVIGGVGLLCVGSVWLCSRIYQELLSAFERAGSLMDHDYSWFCGLLLNLAGYSTVLVPGFILYKYVEKYSYFDKINSNSYVYRLLYACFGSHERIAEGEPPGGPAGVKGPPGPGGKGPAELAFCCTGLMGAYLVWGLLQEKVMTQDYIVSDGAVVRFTDSQFLVFVNRLAALVLAAGRLHQTRTALVAAPLHRFSYCALSNVVSAWCQYEALKYVGFPTQVLSKSCKVLPVMLMGVVVSRQKYEPYEYGTAALISLGMVLFMFGSHVNAPVWGVTSASGLQLLSLYMLCDSFTSSWQAALFARHGVTPLQMLVAVNLCSCLLTAASLAHRADTAASLALLQHGGFAADVVLLSCSSALGQLLIYRTIAGFGAVVFTIIMTLRQAVSILLSCLVYGHRISASGAAGILLVFAAVLLRLYARARSHRPPAR